MVFATTSYLVSEEKELEFLRKISEIMVIFLLPKGYSLSPLKNLLSELLSFKSGWILFTKVENILFVVFLSSLLSDHSDDNLSGLPQPEDCPVH